MQQEIRTCYSHATAVELEWFVVVHLYIKYIVTAGFILLSRVTGCQTQNKFKKNMGFLLMVKHFLFP